MTIIGIVTLFAWPMLWVEELAMACKVKSHLALKPQLPIIPLPFGLHLDWLG